MGEFVRGPDSWFLCHLVVRGLPYTQQCFFVPRFYLDSRIQSGLIEFIWLQLGMRFGRVRTRNSRIRYDAQRPQSSVPPSQEEGLSPHESGLPEEDIRDPWIDLQALYALPTASGKLAGGGEACRIVPVQNTTTSGSSRKISGKIKPPTWRVLMLNP